MEDNKSAEESPKRKVAKRVITQKRKYFFPETGVTVDADDSVEAAKKHDGQVAKQEEAKEGDAN